MPTSSIRSTEKSAITVSAGFLGAFIISSLAVQLFRSYSPAVQNKLTITPQTDRSYIKSANIEWFFGLPKKIKTINYKNISRSISKKMARKYAFHATLNAGAFAISSDEKIWH